MTTGAIAHHPFSSPVCLAFSMGTTQPITLLPEMTLSAQFVAVIKVYLLPLGINQKIAIFLVMTLDARQFPVAAAMVDDNIPMGIKRAVCDLHLFISMADAAAITADGILAGEKGKKSES